jgi:4-hydroxymandelate oxidase
MVGHLNAPGHGSRCESIPPGIVAVADYEALARVSLPDDVFAYVAGGAADEITLRENENAFRAIRLRSRLLRDMTGAHRRLSLFGGACESPLILGPAAYQMLLHPEGEHATAIAAAATQTIMTVSTQSSVALEALQARPQRRSGFSFMCSPIAR